MPQPRFHSIHVLCLCDYNDVAAVLKALESGAVTEQVIPFVAAVPKPGLPPVKLEIETTLGESLRLESHMGNVMVEFRWKLADEHLLVAAIQKLADLKRRTVSVNGRTWTTAAQALAAWPRKF
ncbi:MAG: hypothetical protein AAB074_14375 [Planctomycetota bacterium]